MRTSLLFLFVFFVSAIQAQQQTFDLTTYSVPTGWKDVSTEYAAGYAITNNQKGTYCQIAIYKSTNSKGSLIEDFESEWQELIIKTYKPSTKPELIPSASENGWDAQRGVAPFDFNGGQSIAMLVTMSNQIRCMSIVILTNTEDYQSAIEKFLTSVNMKKTEISVETKNSALDNTLNSIVGTWGKGSSVNAKYNDPVSSSNAGYSKEQYTFFDDGKYTYVSKIFRSSMTTILIGKESGLYQMNGSVLNIIPKEGTNEEWTKKDGVDQYGQLKSKQNRNLEKVNYQFTKHYFSGIQQWNLVLQGDNTTQRDGAFSTNTTFKNAWYYSPISSNNPIIELPTNRDN